MTRNLVATIEGAKERLASDPGSARLFFANGKPLGEGSIYKNPDLGDLLQTLGARGGVGSFYQGDIANKIAAAFQKNGGLVTADDLAAYKAIEVKPLSLEFAGHMLYTPPPSSGGLTVLQTLASLDALGWTKWNKAEEATTHAKVEALRISWQDRLLHLGDPKQTDVPVERLLSAKYAKETAARVEDALKAKKLIEGKTDGRPSGGTIHLNAVDSTGLTVALTFTHGGYFGAQVTIDGLGLVLGHGVSRFDPRPGRANSPAPGKRPLHNMCPTVVTKEDNPVLALGATGGRKIVNSVFDVLAYRLGQGFRLSDAVKAPRIHTEGDTVLSLEPSWPLATTNYLRSIGYQVKFAPGAALNAIERDPVTGELASAAR